MATASKTTVIKTIPDADEFITSALAIIKAVGSYSGELYSDPETNGQLSELQVVATALQSALQQATMRASQRGMAPAPAPEPQSGGRPNR